MINYTFYSSRHLKRLSMHFNMQENRQFLDEINYKITYNNLLFNIYIFLTKPDIYHRLIKVGKLRIPSTPSTRDYEVSKRFAERRLISLSLSLIHLYQVLNVSNQDTISENEASLIEAFGKNL